MQWRNSEVAREGGGKIKAIAILLALLIITWIGLGAATLIPQATAHHVSYLGYRALCSFTPYSTLICFALAGAFYLVYRRIA